MDEEEWRKKTIERLMILVSNNKEVAHLSIKEKEFDKSIDVINLIVKEAEEILKEVEDHYLGCDQEILSLLKIFRTQITGVIDVSNEIKKVVLARKKIKEQIDE